MPIFAADDYMFKELVDLTTITTTAVESSIIEAPAAPYKSSYGSGGAIKSSFHPFNGGLLHLIVTVLGTLPASTDAGKLKLELYTNSIDSDTGTLGDDCDRLVASYGAIDAGTIRFDDGIALDTILPENLGTRIQLKASGTAFAAVDGANPYAEILIEEYSTVHAKR